MDSFVKLLPLSLIDEHIVQMTNPKGSSVGEWLGRSLAVLRVDGSILLTA